jgi:diguanylate cyclase (GGDEF)-like protein
MNTAQVAQGAVGQTSPQVAQGAIGQTMTAEKQCILIVDDEASNRTVLTEMFKLHHKVMLAKSGEMAIELAQKHAPDLILLDVLMPGWSGYETIEKLKAIDATREIPVIFITALDGSIDEERGLLLGAVDYITKPFHPAIVRARVRNHLRSVRQRVLLERFAMFDTLTELPNRRRLERAMSVVFSAATPLSIAMLDVDHFKNFNDTYGHSQGDKVLQAVADVFRSFAHQNNAQASRYGGEEFVLWLPGFDQARATELCEKVRTEIEQISIEHPSGLLKVSISIGGCSSVASDSGQAPLGMLELADAALYQAKTAGRNRVHWHGN